MLFKLRNGESGIRLESNTKNGEIKIEDQRRGPNERIMRKKGRRRRVSGLKEANEKLSLDQLFINLNFILSFIKINLIIFRFYMC